MYILHKYKKCPKSKHPVIFPEKQILDSFAETIYTYTEKACKNGKFQSMKLGKIEIWSSFGSQ